MKSRTLLGGRPGPAGYPTVTTRRYAMPDGDEDEFCEVVTLPVADFVSHVRSGELTDADVAWMCLDRPCPWPPWSVIEGAGLSPSSPDQQ